MNQQRLTCVLTTVQAPTASVVALAQTLERCGSDLIVIGDRKGPPVSGFGFGELFTIDEQLELSFELASLLPENHYSRKNLGYLIAIERGAASIYETDDDNMPLPDWMPRSLCVRARPITVRPWANAYRFFSPGALFWPRGFPLDLATDPVACSLGSELPVCQVDAPIQQGLANGAPDVDAVWRLLFDEEHTFGQEQGASLLLPPKTWCPFNSQTTWWWAVAYPLMYLPSHCTFRMTDIWRSFIAQRCLWELGHGVVFHAAEVVQERNTHNLMRDFEDEIPGYLGNRQMCTLLDELPLKAGLDEVGRNLRRCYAALVEAGFFPATELVLVDAWLADLLLIGSKESATPPEPLESA